MKVYIILILTLCQLGIAAQSYDEYVKSANQYYSEGDFLKSGNTYDLAFELKEGDSRRYYDAACSWALANDTIRSITYLHRSAAKGWKNIKHILSDKHLQTLHNLKSWPAVLVQVQNNLSEYEKDFDHPLKNKLEEIYVKDQTLRQLYQEA